MAGWRLGIVGVVALAGLGLVRAGNEPATAEGRYRAAWEALVHGRSPEAEALLRQGHALDPSHRPTARLVAVLDRLDAPKADPDVAALRRLMPGPTAVARGRGVVLVQAATTPATVTAGRLDLLDRGLTTFLLHWTAHGFDLKVPTRRLPVLWFDDPAAYRAFLRDEGASALAATSGYFHPTRQLVAVAEPAGRDAARIRIGTALHELVHLLVAETGLEPSAGAFPLWLHEGLAMQFEATEGGRWAGPGGLNAIRLGHWRGMATRPRLAPLVRDVGFEPGYATDRYAAAWALVAYLGAERPADWDAFLDLLRAPRDDAVGRADHFEACFRAAFGDDLDATEAAWRRFAGRLGRPAVAAAGAR